MAVDYEEGRRLVKEWDKIGTVDTHEDLFNWFYANKDALLNPWRPISELPEDWPEETKCFLGHKDDPSWTCIADGPPDEDEGRLYCDGWHVEPSHFMLIKPPGAEQ